ncbi:cytochrome c biogenesis protein CcsA [Campylobacter californiensis]|uniref:cytochrome c biogenesis protein CcsA n=1 Tax=Campylobacter californiensis TaxID=1032243 RepID=UPI00147442C4|nr:cytochrome c biogenesis protein CcsA [Campylobacter sp. RM12916]MBE3610075.1 cytochrome c biogenesis protein CcsA [Campylobacter sp. RM12916]
MFGFKSVFLSMSSAIVLMIIFAIGSGAATIIESKSGTEAAWFYVYGAGWFAFVQLLLGINLAYNIYQYKLLNVKKLPSLLFHAGFIVILIGAGITRYFGFEGNVHIRENSQTNIVTTKGTYISLSSLVDGQEVTTSIPRSFNDIVTNGFDIKLKIGQDSANMKFVEYLPSAAYRFVDDEGGRAVIELTISDDENREDVYLLEGEEVVAGDISFLFNTMPKSNQKFVLFKLENGKFSVTSSMELSKISMIDSSKSVISPESVNEFEEKNLYTIEGVNFISKFISAKAKRKLMANQNGEFDVVNVLLTYKGESKEIPLFYNLIEPSKATVAGQQFNASWGLQQIKLPFSLYLKDFELKRYPGSNSPMSYASEVVVKDGDSPSFDYRIYMNHVLDYDGYRFFQSSYDQDERGTILSVNKDPGKIPTYIGYFLLGIGFFLNVVNPTSRFRKLAKLIDNDSVKKVASFLVIGLFALNLTQLKAADDFLPRISPEHAKKLSRLIVQSPDGRMKPFDTLSKEVLNKFHRKDRIGSLDSNQAALSIMVMPEFWRNEFVIALGSSSELKKVLGVSENAKYASFNDFFKPGKDGRSEYKLTKFAEQANRKHPGSRGTFDKDVIKIDERLNVFYMMFIGEIFKIFPKQDDPSNTWYSPASAMMYFSPEEGNLVIGMMRDYFTAVDNAVKTQEWSEADKALDKIFEYQNNYGSQIMPAKQKIETELLFNKLQVFDRLTPIYLLAGLVLLLFVFIKMLAPKLNIDKIVKVIYGINLLAFAVHTVGLGLRWYIAEHAPWSNAYESMVYIAWALGLSGIVFSKRSPIAIALTSILAGVTLFVAHLSWMDPQITTLVPVLQSYWLTIHVSIITASYGFLGLCALLGGFVLILIIMQSKKKPNEEISRNITEATRINEMAMILGLSLLTLGNFLGGVWANESWGRYWGWDSKETWALVSILVYAAVLHIRFIPKLNNQYAFAAASFFAYWAILMTYFGVNFYLAGMHSYAAGDPLPVPDFIWIMIGVMVAITLLAYPKRNICSRL